MKEYYSESEYRKIRNSLLGLGSQSIRKSYYPIFRERVKQLSRFRNLLNNIHEAIFLCRYPELEIIDCNQTVRSFINRSPEGILYQNLTDVLKGDKTDFLFKSFTRYDNINHMEMLLDTFNDQPLYVEIDWQKKTFDHREYLILTIRDITYRKNLEEKLQKRSNQIEKQNEELTVIKASLIKEKEQLEYRIKERTSVIRDKNLKLEHNNIKLNQYQQKIRNEVFMTQKIQSCIIPQTFPENPFLKFAGHYRPLTDLGGDYYDIFELNPFKFAVVIADVSGHGIASAFLTAMMKISFENHMKKHKTAGEILNEINQEICSTLNDLDYSLYFTAFLAIIDIEHHSVQFSSAGHPNAIILRNNGVLEDLKVVHPMVGVQSDISYQTKVSSFKKGDQLIMYTDGLTEIVNEEGIQFGKSSLEEIIRHHRKDELNTFKDAIIRESLQYGMNQESQDDIALMITQFNAESDTTETVNKIISSKKTKKVKSFHKARKFFKENKFRKARKYLKDLHDKMPKTSQNIAVCEMLAEVYTYKHKYYQAMECWQYILSLNPNHQIAIEKITALQSLISLQKSG